MKVEKALDILQRLKIPMATSNADGDGILEALLMAVQALEKQIPSNKTYEDCQYCGGDVNMRDYLLSNGDAGAYIDGNNKLQGDDEFYFEELKLNYCPMCGGRF